MIQGVQYLYRTADVGCFGDTRSVAFVSIADMSYQLLKVGVHRSNLVLCDAEARSGALFLYTLWNTVAMDLPLSG